MKWYEKQKKLYTQNQEEQKNTPFGDRASIRGNDAVCNQTSQAALWRVQLPWQGSKV